MNHPNCRCALLATGAIGHVSACPHCQQVHLTLQYLTLRFDANAFRELMHLLVEAQRRMDNAAARTAGMGAVTARIH